ncbi:MAG: O-antigen ligase family protein [Hydrogenophaga sp.]|nr:O-antigen ligase family protein [Hydrogenophaga sp.]
MSTSVSRVKSHPPAPESLAATVGWWIGCLLLFVAPLIRGGNRGVALIGLEWLALALLVTVAWRAMAGERLIRGAGFVRWGLLLLATAPLWVALLQLTPMPPGLWSSLPGRGFYQEILQGLGLWDARWRPASLMPDATQVSLLAAIPLVACLFLGLTCPKDRLWLLFRVCVVAALLQALLGLAQLGPSKALYFGAYFKGVIGTFANSNHLAGFLAMCLPLVVWEMLRAQRGRSSGRAWGWGGVLLVLLMTVFATGSRAGLGVAVLVTALALLLLPGERGPVPWRWRLLLLAGLLGAGLLAAGAAGLRGFGPAALARGLGTRQVMFLETWEASKAFWPLGSGLGTFSGVYPRFQTGVSGRYFVEHAHSDYVQFLMETGLLGVVLGALVLALLAVRANDLRRRLSHESGLRREDEARLAAGLGLLALLLHAWVDFNMRIPALAMLGAFLFGVFVRSQRDAGNEHVVI